MPNDRLYYLESQEQRQFDYLRGEQLRVIHTHIMPLRYLSYPLRWTLLPESSVKMTSR